MDKRWIGGWLSGFIPVPLATAGILLLLLATHPIWAMKPDSLSRVSPPPEGPYPITQTRSLLVFSNFPDSLALELLFKPLLAGMQAQKRRPRSAATSFQVKFTMGRQSPLQTLLRTRGDSISVPSPPIRVLTGLSQPVQTAFAGYAAVAAGNPLALAAVGFLSAVKGMKVLLDRPIRPGTFPQEIILEALEIDILKLAWKQGQIQAGEVYLSLTPNYRIEYATLRTILNRLVRLGLLKPEDNSVNPTYQVLVSRDQVIRAMTATLVNPYSPKVYPSDSSQRQQRDRILEGIEILHQQESDARSEKL